MRTINVRNAISLAPFVGILGILAFGCSSQAATPDSGPLVSGAPNCGGPPPAAPAAGAALGPCDIYANDGGPCVAAHSTVRALYATFDQPLYQVKKSDGTTMDIKPVQPGGLADGAAQDTFCGTDACTISIIYDQSGKGNHLTSAPGGGAKTTPDNEANAKSAPLMAAKRSTGSTWCRASAIATTPRAARPSATTPRRSTWS